MDNNNLTEGSAWSEEVPFTKENIAAYYGAGLFRLRDGSGNCVYIGRTTVRPIRKRLSHFFNNRDSACCLRKTLKTDKQMMDEQIDSYFATLKVSIIYGWGDFKEYYIKIENPKFNNLLK